MTQQTTNNNMPAITITETCADMSVKTEFATVADYVCHAEYHLEREEEECCGDYPFNGAIDFEDEEEEALLAAFFAGEGDGEECSCEGCCHACEEECEEADLMDKLLADIFGNMCDDCEEYETKELASEEEDELGLGALLEEDLSEMVKLKEEVSKKEEAEPEVGSHEAFMKFFDDLVNSPEIKAAK